MFLVSNVSSLGSQIDKVTDEKSHAYCSDEDSDGFPQASREHCWPWVFPNYYERNCSILCIQQSLEHVCWICACGHACDVHKEYHISAKIVIGGGIIPPAEQRLPYRILKMHAVCIHTGVYKYIILCDGIAECISSTYQHPVFGRDFHYLHGFFQGDQGDGTLFEVWVGSWNSCGLWLDRHQKLNGTLPTDP